MNREERETIFKNMNVLSENINLDSNLLNQLINKNIFTQHMINDILKIEDKMSRNKRFLSDLCRRGPEAYDTVVEILYGVGQEPAAKVLRPNSFQSGLNPEQTIQNIVTNSPPDVGGGDIGLDSRDHSLEATTLATVENEDFMINVVKCKKEMIGKNIYRMNANPRGYCLIFNNFEFVNDSYPKRKGSETEANRLRDVFNQLHFAVEVKNNSTKEQMLFTISEFSKRRDLRTHDAFVLIVLSHGDSGYIITSDCLAFNFEEIVDKFNNENCPLLRNRPKLFFFNCCRGDNRDSGPKEIFEDMDTSAVSDAKTWTKVPTASDVLICYSTVNGYVSWRNEENGSWFGTALCQSLMKHSHDKDLHYILTITTQLVNKKITQNGEKQVMEYTFRGWMKLFYFNPGIHTTASLST